MQRTYFIRKHIYGIAAVLMAVCLIVCSITQYSSACSDVRSGVLRLHVIANSDSDADQLVKLKVRDKLLTVGADIFDGSVTAAQAESKITPNLNSLQQAANAVLTENGFDYSANAQLVYEYFDTRSYDDVTLPAGYYTALKVTLGNGEGKNWWCVMFPPLCLPACTAAQDENDEFAVFANDGASVVHAEGGYKIKLKIVELVQKFIEDIKDKTD